MFKKFITLLLVLCLMLSAFPVFAADGYLADMEQKEQLACSMKALGLFVGVSNYEFELDRAPSRTEALIMLLRLLGEIDEASAFTGSHPFTDTADISWADKYIAYAYSEGLTSGRSDTEFGGKDTANVRTYLTFVLRALGYIDSENGDFTWSNPYELAKKVGILPSSVSTANFRRGDVVLISYAALGAKLKGSSKTLIEHLIDIGAVTDEQYRLYYDASALTSGCFQRSKFLEIEEFMLRLDISDGMDLTGKTIKNYGSVSRFGDMAVEMYGFYKAGADKNAAQVRSAAQVLDGKARVFYLIVPNGAGIMLSDADFAKYVRSSKTEGEGIAYTYEQAGSKVIGVDTITALRAHNQEYVTFRTDHHWTGLGAYYAYREWAKDAGFEPVDIQSYTPLVMPGHFGMFYGMCGNPAEMKNNPDTVISYIPESDISVKITNLSNKTYDGQLVYDYSNSGYKYGSFIGGDNPITVITNNDIRDESACVIVKDSNGNALPGFLSQHYHTVYVLDYRYYYKLPGYLTFSQFADQKGVTDFIVCASLTLSQSETTAKYLAKYCK